MAMLVASCGRAEPGGGVASPAPPGLRYTVSEGTVRLSGDVRVAIEVALPFPGYRHGTFREPSGTELRLYWDTSNNDESGYGIDILLALPAGTGRFEVELGGRELEIDIGPAVLGDTEGECVVTLSRLDSEGAGSIRCTEVDWEDQSINIDFPFVLS